MYIRLTILTVTVVIGSELMAQSPFDALKDMKAQLEDSLRSATEASNRPSMAMIDRETARSMNYDNQLKHVRTYYEKRKLNRMYREAERPRRRGPIKRSSPDRLTIRQYDPYAGRVQWPVVFTTADYRQQRQQLDRLFSAHAKAGSGMNTPYYAPIQSSLKQLDEQLFKTRSKVNTEQRVYARRFLRSLQFEARYPVGS